MTGLVFLSLAALAASPSGASARQKPYADPGKESPYPTPPAPASPAPPATAGELSGWLARLAGETRPDVALDARLVRRLNVTRVGGGGDLALLMRDARPGWPSALRRAPFAAERARVEGLLPEAAKRARAGAKGSDGDARDLTRSAESLSKELVEQVAELTPTEYVQAKRFLERIERTAAALRAADVRQALAAADGLQKGVKTVAGLAAYLQRERLTLTPPLAGDEDAYLDLRRAITGYANGQPTRPAGK
jgi:hypothetical protein